MNPHNNRFRSTVAVWAAFAVIMIGLFAALIASAALLSETIILILAVWSLLLAIVAGASTMMIWRGAGREAPPLAGSAQDKAKHSSADRLKRLIDSLEEDEVIELETLLLVQEGQQRRQ